MTNRQKDNQHYEEEFLALSKAQSKKYWERQNAAVVKPLEDTTEKNLEEALAYLRTLANFGGTLEASRALAQKAVDKLNKE